MNGTKGLEAFCKDLASDQPAPGGGSASAAAGAMAASLLSMVCGVTLKSKKHEPNWPELAALRRKADSMAGMLLRRVDEDSMAYEMLVLHSRNKRNNPGDVEAAATYDKAVKLAMGVPTMTAKSCVDVLRLAEEVAALGTKSASSDIEVARLLAAAGVEGAVANVLINLPYCDDQNHVSRARETVEALRREKTDLLKS